MSNISRILIKVPQKPTHWWRISSNGGGSTKRASAELVYRYVERKILKLLASAEGDKTVVSLKVDYGCGSYNETIDSNNWRYLLYAVACFLEEYLNHSGLKRAHKKYGELNET